MPLFLALALKVVPLYVNLILGFVAGRWLHVQRESIAALMLYIIVPVVFFGGISHMEFSPALLFVPLLSYSLSCLIGLSTYRFSRSIYHDSRANIMAMAAGTGNNGYFGLPIALLLFDAQTVAVYLTLVIGTSLYESSIGFFMAARGQHTVGESLRRTARLPALYAFAAGIIVSFNGWRIPDALYDLIHYFKGAYVVLGMMMIGLGLSCMTRLSIDKGFTSILFLVRFAVWPLLAALFIRLDLGWLHIYPPEVHRALTLFSIMPLAANSVAIASLLKCQPEKTATAVLLSTLFAILYVPLMAGWLL